jgi:hypothetical protein
VNVLKRVRLHTLVLIIIAVLLIVSYPENMIFIVFSMYVLSGLIEYIYKVGELRKKRRQQIVNKN